MKSLKQLLILCIAGLASIWSALLAHACPNPIFAQALDMWSVDDYEIVINNTNAVAADSQKALAHLQDALHGRQANLRISTETQTNQNEKISLMTVRIKDSQGSQQILWEGVPDEKLIQNLISSPTRTKLINLLKQRKAVVWVLLESGNKSRDQAAERILQKELKRSEATLAPAESGSLGGAGWGGGPPDLASPPISFALLRVRRDDPAEAMFVKMLLLTKPGLEKAADEPIAFPIYGRGLALDALVGKSIEQQRVWMVGEFLTGPCSCDFLEAWHGFSLLLKTNWDDIPPAGTGTPSSATIGAAGFLKRLDQTDQKLSAQETSEEQDKP